MQTPKGSKLTERIRTPRTNKAERKRGGNNNFTFQTMHQALQQQGPTQETSYSFYFDVQIPDKPDAPKVDIMVTPDYKVSDAMLKAIDKFNDQYREQGFELDTDVKNYNVRLAKKNGRPKMDMPLFDPKQKMIDLKIDKVAVQIKNKDAVKQPNAKPASTATTVSSVPTPDVIQKESNKALERQLQLQVPRSKQASIPKINESPALTDLDNTLAEAVKKSNPSVSNSAQQRDKGISMDITIQEKKASQVMPEPANPKKKSGCFSSIC